MTAHQQPGSPIEDYLDELLVALVGQPRRARHVLLEAEDHLRSSAESLVAEGFEPTEAEAEAVRRYGPVPDVARANLRVAPIDLARPLVGLSALGLIAVGVSGLVAEVMGRLWGPMFVAGDLTGTTYTSDRCVDFTHMFPGRTCLEAAAMDHWGEVVQFRVLAGIFGLVALLAYRQFRASAMPLPAGIVSGVALAAFGLACLLLAWLSIVPAIDHGSGLGTPLSGVLVSFVMVVACAWRLRSDLAGRPRAGAARR
jgi:hypothetical protein